MPRGRGGFKDARGGKRSKKGQRRHFTDEEALKEEEKKEKDFHSHRRKEGSDDSSDEDSYSSSDGSESGDERKAKGIEGIIEIHNPNRNVKQSKKVTAIESDEKVVLSRREREEIEKNEAKKKYDQMHMEGKTAEAQADLARLAIIRKQREEQAKKREIEKKELEEKAKQKKS